MLNICHVSSIFGSLSLLLLPLWAVLIGDDLPLSLMLFSLFGQRPRICKVTVAFRVFHVLCAFHVRLQRTLTHWSNQNQSSCRTYDTWPCVYRPLRAKASPCKQPGVSTPLEKHISPCLSRASFRHLHCAAKDRIRRGKTNVPPSLFGTFQHESAIDSALSEVALILRWS